MQKLVKLKKKLTDHKHDKYITTPEFNKLTAENFAERLKQVNLVSKTDFDYKLTSINRKIISNKTKDLVIFYDYYCNWYLFCLFSLAF